MEQEATPSVVKPTRVPWNKGKLVGAKPPLRPSHVWSIRTKLQIEGRSAILRCSTWRSTASCGAVTSLPFVLMTWRRAVTRWTARRFAKEDRSAGPVRADRPNTDGHRRYLRLTGRIPGQFLFAGRGDGPGTDNPTVRPTRPGVGGEHRS